MGSDIGLARALFQVTSFDDSYSGVKAVAAQVRAALQRYRGTINGDVIQDIYLENELDLYDDRTAKHMVPVNATVWYEE